MTRNKLDSRFRCCVATLETKAMWCVWNLFGCKNFRINRFHLGLNVDSLQSKPLCNKDLLTLWDLDLELAFATFGLVIRATESCEGTWAHWWGIPMKCWTSLKEKTLQGDLFSTLTLFGCFSAVTWPKLYVTNQKFWQMSFESTSYNMVASIDIHIM